jgi:hypothetical protein
MRALLRLSPLTKILIIGSTKLSLRNLVNPLIIDLLGLSPFVIMNVLSSCCMLLMTMFGV